MTIAAVGAVALGQYGEAAMLGILFSIAEGLERYAVSKTRRGLRSLLALVPPDVLVPGDVSPRRTEGLDDLLCATLANGGAPGRTRTCDQIIRSELLCPAELRRRSTSVSDPRIDLQPKDG